VGREVEPLIDIVGHFGTTFSYATVASRVARALRAEGLLGSVANLDAEWHGAHEDLLRAAPLGRAESGSHVVLFTPPNHYVDVYADLYGRDQSAIFMSPNTDRLAPEHAETCRRFGLALVPSAWCEATVRRDVATRTALLPLGVAPVYAESRRARQDHLRWRASHEEGCRVLHFSTDQAWPGRKGTEELLRAWASLQGDWTDTRGSRLTVHAPPALRTDIEYLVRDLGIDDTVNVIVGSLRGSEDDLLALLDRADLVVAPSRCEGFGLMFLSALVAGVPLLGTYSTGQVDFLSQRSGWLGVAAHGAEPLFGEDGDAPVVDVASLVAALRVVLQPEARMAMTVPRQGEDERWGTWPLALEQWVERLKEWAEETA
jgi:glycosyltransferase involved in cell wall biosynthesis